MIVLLSTDAPPVLIDLDRLDRLHAECAVPVEQADLGDLCRPGPDAAHVWLSVAGARDAGSSSATSTDFGSRFDAMISYAASKGWLDDTGSWVRAHVEPTGAPTRPT